jgi:hypothetical protein
MSLRAAILAVVVAVAAGSAVEAKRGGIPGGPNGQGGGWKQTQVATPGIPAVPSHGRGSSVPLTNGVPAVAPDFHQAAKALDGHGSARSEAQHIVNSVHPKGHARATSEHLLNSANNLLKAGKHGHGKWK